jgi:subtilisin family serine protease
MQTDTIAQAWRSQKIRLMPNIEMSHFSGGLEVTNYSVHSMTGVDKLHAQGILGKGAKIAVVDTGVDYLHPAVSIPETRYRSTADRMLHKLGSGFGPNFKIVGGYDFVGDGRKLFLRPDTNHCD